MLLFVLVVGARVVFLVFLVEGFGVKVPSLLKQVPGCSHRRAFIFLFIPTSGDSNHENRHTQPDKSSRHRRELTP